MASSDVPPNTPSVPGRSEYADVAPVGGAGRGWVITTCVLLSALLWLAFSLRRSTTVTLKLQTRVVNLPANESLAAPAPDSVEYVVSGEAISILPVYYNRPTVEIDAALDEVDFELGGAAFPVDVRVEAASPRRYIPQREARVSKRVPIENRATLSVPPTHAYVLEPFIQPDSVVISGARSVIEGISSWPTSRLNLTNVTDSVHVQLPLSDSLDGIVSIGRSRTSLTAEVAEFTQGTREIDVRLTGASTSQPAATLDPSRIAVSFRVRVQDYKTAISSPDFYANVPYDQVRGDTTGRVRPLLNFPSGVLIRDPVMNPPMVRYFNVLYDQ